MNRDEVHETLKGQEFDKIFLDLACEIKLLQEHIVAIRREIDALRLAIKCVRPLHFGGKL